MPLQLVSGKPCVTKTEAGEGHNPCLLVISLDENVTVIWLATSLVQTSLRFAPSFEQEKQISFIIRLIFGNDFLSETVTLIRNSAATEHSAGSWARKPDKHTGLVGQLSQVEQQTLRLKLLT